MRKMLLISNMYPTPKYPAYGSFVKQFYENVLDDFDVKLVVLKKHQNKIYKILSYVLFYIRIVFNCLLHNYDVTYVHYISHVSLPILLCKKIKVFKLIVNVHGSDVIPSKSFGKFLFPYTSRVLEVADRIVVPSDYYSNYVISHFNLEDKKVFVYPSGGVSSLTFNPNKKHERDKLLKQLMLKDLEYYCFASRIDEKKGWDILVEAINILKSRDPNFFNNRKFIIIGSGSCEKRLNNLIEKYELEEMIIRVDMVSREVLSMYFSISKWFIFPTYMESESLGLVGIEAMASGTPIIASNFAGPTTYVKDGVNGYFFEVKNYMSLVDKILLTSKLNNKEYLEICKNALNTAKQFYPENLKEKFTLIFDF
ncbi:glycosyltransferase family 4 protein [Amedibacterium intestinale]|uniref:glycosyltransferase family 4 protein n=1 Tax=Amedibacterium intestinale TaxID=2583452 RepID=UPI000E479044|nr:glycosyltransferase family 4 protein [Amedibacterium intestinale]RHO21532.1 glycosyltransferase family 1 protein [Eubacterium sp. AM18-26]RHO25696.1 glycosyltransferase family 1 protein [Eubacterium sp. AM18-10LB-B]RHO28957.1 glycosyltransferase family 1 protein [Erysipelotrichaceae bacterium AM17-60]